MSIYYLETKDANNAFYLNFTKYTLYNKAKTTLIYYFILVLTFEKLRTKFY